ncbi:MAG: YraN family protein [bacterium]
MSISGREAEILACKHLKQAGLKLVTRNFTTRVGEIDIIARDGDTLVFVEVRFRKHLAYGSAAETIDHGKQRKITKAATQYLQKCGLWDKIPCRFDTVCIINSAEHRTPEIQWLRNAFGIESY